MPVNELYGTEGTHGSVSAFAIDPVTRHLTYQSNNQAHGRPVYTSIEPEGKFILVGRS